MCDPAKERKLIDALLDAIKAGAVRSAHDCSDGGLAVALAECAIVERDAMLGFSVDLSPWEQLPHRALLFGEAHGRVVVSTDRANDVIAIATKHGVPARIIGTVTPASEGARFAISDDAFAAPIEWLARAFHDSIGVTMDGETPAEHAVTASHAPSND